MAGITFYDQFGKELEGAHTHTRGMFLDILPPDLKEEIRKKKKLASAGHRELAAWCRERCILQRKEILSEQTKKHFAYKTSKMNKLGRNSPTEETEGISLHESDDSDYECGPSHAKSLKKTVTTLQKTVAALHNAQVAANTPTPTKPTGPGTEKQRRDNRTGSPRRRSTSPGVKIDWPKGRCFHCGSDDHT